MHHCAVVQCSRLSWMSWPASSHSNIQSKSSQSLASNFAAIILAYVLKSIRYLNFKLGIQSRIQSVALITDPNRIISLFQRIIKWIITKFCFFEYLIFVCMNSDQSYENNVCFRIWNKEDFLYDYFSITEYSSFQKIKYDQYLSVSLCVKKFIFKSWILNLKFKFWKDFYMRYGGGLA